MILEACLYVHTLICVKNLYKPDSLEIGPVVTDIGH